MHFRSFLSCALLRLALVCSALIAVLIGPAFAGALTISSPAPSSNSVNAVRIAASASEQGPFHLEVWDNGNKLGNVFSNAVNAIYNLPNGPHTTTVLAVSNNGIVLDSNFVNYQVSANASSANGISIGSPAGASTSINAVRITASADENVPFHLEVWDNGFKLGNILSNSVDGVYVLPNGPHTTTIVAVGNDGSFLGQNSVNYTVAQNCANSPSVVCNLDQQEVDNTQGYCDPPPASAWIANPCGPGIQGPGGADPQHTDIQPVAQGGTLPDQGNLTLNGGSVHLIEAQGSAPSNVLFRAQSPLPASTSSVDSHWILDGYVYLPNPTAHQAFEMDAQYSIAGIWTKFYTECAFNMQNGSGYWAVFDTQTGGWIFLNGQPQGGQTPPVVPCNRSQFSQPWPGSSNPSFTGWHHIAWSFVRDGDGTVTYQSLTFDGNTTQINFHPASQSGGSVSDNGDFGALVQLDGTLNTNGQTSTVDAYISELTLTHTP